MGYRVVNGKLCSVEELQSYSQITTDKLKNKDDKNFKDILKDVVSKNDQFIISKHAAERLKSRNISFNESDMKRINEGINKADKKGAKDCVILYKDVALVTSIKNRTVITALENEAVKGNVFTNIDSLVLL